MKLSHLRLWLVPLFLAAFGLFAAWQRAETRPALADDPVPSWIWLNKSSKEDETVYFRKSFEIKGTVKSAKIYASCDNRMRLFVDGRQAGESRSWETPLAVDATRQLKNPGRHLLAVQGINEGSAAGLVLKLVVETTDQGTYSIVTDNTWRVSAQGGGNNAWARANFADQKWGSAVEIVKVGGGPWGGAIDEKTLVSGANTKEPPATDPKTLKVAKGFKVELLYSVPKIDQGSWVCMTTDPKGRLIVSDQYGKLYRVEPPPPGETLKPEQIQEIPVKIGEAQGLLWAFDSLYVMVNAGGQFKSGLYRVKDTNGDDVLDKVETLRELQGGGEHGPHAILLSPDGKSLHVVCGNGTQFVGTKISKVPLLWSEDHILPRMPDGNGFMANVYAPGGCIYKIDPDGKQWELVSSGYRNEYDAAFNREGELFAYDADMEWDANTPWYRPTRVCLATSGSEFGWRNGAGKWPAYYPDSVPSVADIGPGSPTGVVFGYGAKFPAKYQEALYICDWSYGKLYAIHFSDDGSSYKSEIEEFVTGTPLPLTDLVVRPQDGALYFAIGGRRTKSGLYRVTYVGEESTAPSQPAPGPGKALRDIRRKLDSFHGHADADAVKTAWPYLGHSDRGIRYSARVAIEHQPVSTWKDQALNESNPIAAINAAIALARASKEDQSAREGLLANLDKIDWASLDDSQRIDLLRAYGLVVMRLGRPSADTIKRLVGRFDPHYPSKDRYVNAELCKMLVYLEAPSGTTKTMDLLRKAPTQEEQMEYMTSLRVAKTGWTMPLREEYFTSYTKAVNFKGGNSLGGFLRRMKSDALLTLSPQEKSDLAPILNAAAPTRTDPKPIASNRPLVKKRTVAELTGLVESGLKDRNFEQGRALFGEASCFSCHRFANEGGAAGPDLTGLAGRFSSRDLLESIVEPSKTISDQYGAVVVALDDGRVVSGRIVNLNDDTIMINTNMLDPNLQERVDRKRIEEMKPSTTSMMPEGLLDVFKDEEILDLMAYLLSRGDRNSPMFQKAGQK